MYKMRQFSSYNITKQKNRSTRVPRIDLVSNINFDNPVISEYNRTLYRQVYVSQPPLWRVYLVYH